MATSYQSVKVSLLKVSCYMVPVHSSLAGFPVGLEMRLQNTLVIIILCAVIVSSWYLFSLMYVFMCVYSCCIVWHTIIIIIPVSYSTATLNFIFLYLCYLCIFFVSPSSFEDQIDAGGNGCCHAHAHAHHVQHIEHHPLHLLYIAGQRAPPFHCCS